MALLITKTLGEDKSLLLNYFRGRGIESLDTIKRSIGESNFKALASEVNKAVADTREKLIKTIVQKATHEGWDNEELLKCVLMATYTSDVVMLELRNEVWPYEYMAFSRRIGELWEDFVKRCFDYPNRPLTFFVPPLFSEVKRQLSEEIESYIDQLNLTSEQKSQLKQYYDKVWSLVTSGEIKLELDLHFEDGVNKINVDFKSGFSSNEKGNTNRLLLVATIYKNLEQGYRCVILVRSDEERNNHYFRTLKTSGIWEASCGNEAYERIKVFTGFDLKRWIQINVSWMQDFHQQMAAHIQRNSLEQYLIW